MQTPQFLQSQAPPEPPWLNEDADCAEKPIRINFEGKMASHEPLSKSLREKTLNLSVYDDDTRFQQLVTKKRRFSPNQDLKKKMGIDAGMANILVALPVEEKRNLLVWLKANPLPQSDQNLVARVILNDGQAIRELLAQLREGSTQQTTDLVRCLGHFAWTAVPRLHKQIKMALPQILDRTEYVVVQQLVIALEKQEPSLWWEPVRRRLLDPNYGHKSILVRLTYKVCSTEVVHIIQKAMAHRAPGEEPSAFLMGLKEMARSTGEAAREAKEALFAAVEALGPEFCSCAYYSLFKLDKDRALPLGEQYLFHVMEQTDLDSDFPASFVLREWALKRGKDHLNLIRMWTAHPKLGRFALETLTELLAGSEDQTLIELWRKYAANHHNLKFCYQVAAIGGEIAKAASLDLLRQSRIRLEKPGILWMLNDITLEKALRISVRYGLLPKMPSNESVLRAIPDGKMLDDPFELWLWVMKSGGRAAFFDVETAMFPNCHDELILDELAKAGDGLFVPAKAVEFWNEETKSYDVAFEHGGRYYHFQAQDMSDHYDVDSVMAAANRALADAGHAERFHALDTNSQMAFLVLAKPEILSASAAELWLPVCKNSSHDRKFKEKINKKIKKLLGIK